MTIKSAILTTVLAWGCAAVWGAEAGSGAEPARAYMENCVPLMTVETLEKVLEEALAEADRKPVDDAELAFALSRDCLMYQRGGDAGERQVLAVAAITLWRGGHDDTLQLAWWRSRSSYARLLVLAVELGSRSQEGLRTSACPYFDPHRYAEEEREIRLGELRWVLDNHAAIHAMLRRLNPDHP